MTSNSLVQDHYDILFRITNHHNPLWFTLRESLLYNHESLLMSSWFMELYGGLQHDHIMRIIIYHTEPGLVYLIISNISPLVDCAHDRLQKLYVDFITPTKLPNYSIVLCNIKILCNDIQTLLLNLLRYVTKTAVYLNVSAKFTSYSHHAVPSFCPFLN